MVHSLAAPMRFVLKQGALFLITSPHPGENGNLLEVIFLLWYDWITQKVAYLDLFYLVIPVTVIIN